MVHVRRGEKNMERNQFLRKSLGNDVVGIHVRAVVVMGV